MKQLKDRKLPVLINVGRALRTVFSTRVLASKFLLKGLIAYCVALEIIGFLNGFFGTLGNQFLGQLSMLPLWYVVAPIGVALHRSVILREDLPPKPFVGFLNDRNMVFALGGLLIGLVPTLYRLVPALLHSEPVWLNLTTLLIIIYGLAFGRIVIFLPSIAIDKKLSLRGCWDATHGNSWRLFGAVLLIGIPIFIIERILVVQLYRIALSSFFEGQIWMSLLSDFISSALLMLGYLLAVALVSHVYIFFAEENTGG